MLRPFSLSERVTAEEAKQDGISIEIGRWFVQATGNHLGSFFDFLAPRPSEENVNAWTNIVSSFPVSVLNEEFFGWMFNRPAGNFDEHTEMDLRGGMGGRITRPNAPLAKGRLIISKRAPFPNAFPEEQCRELRLSLFLNPTRFLRHQKAPRIARRNGAWRDKKPNLKAMRNPKRKTSSDEDPREDIETSLDGNDNVLIDPRTISFARPELWPIHLKRYFDAVESTIQAEFVRSGLTVSSGAEGVFKYNRAPYYSLRKVETYFEFSHENPLRLIRKLQPALEAIGTSHKSRSFPLGLGLNRSDSNARSVVVKLRGGRLLRVYAKTTHRIRFEIEHDVKKASISKLLFANGGGHTTGSQFELLGWFEHLAEDAAEQVNNVLEHLESRRRRPDLDSASVYEFLGEIFGTIPNERRAKDFLKILVENGCVRVGQRGTDFLPEIRQLRRKGILENIRGVNQLTFRFQRALDVLREQDRHSVLNLNEGI